MGESPMADPQLTADAPVIEDVDSSAFNPFVPGSTTTFAGGSARDAPPPEDFRPMISVYERNYVLSTLFVILTFLLFVLLTVIVCTHWFQTPSDLGQDLPRADTNHAEIAV